MGKTISKNKEFIRMYLPKNISFDFRGVPTDRNIVVFVTKILGVSFASIGSIHLNNKEHYADVIYVS